MVPSVRGGKLSAVAPAEKKLWSLKTAWFPGVEALSWMAHGSVAVLG